MAKKVVGMVGQAQPAIVVSTGAAPGVVLLQDREAIGDFDTATGWTALSNDTITIAAVDTHILGTHSIEFDKVDGADNEKFAGCSCTVAADASRFMPSDVIECAIYVSSNVDVDYAFIRMGTDVSNYTEWRLADASLTDGAGGHWSTVSIPIDGCELTVTGTGWDPSAITYLSVGVMFDLETDALADIKFDHVYIVGSLIAA